MNPARTRVVITGRGVISSIGNDVATYWDNLVNGRSGVDQVTLFDASPFPTQIAAEVKDWNPSKWINRKEARRMSRCSQFALVAADQALNDANLTSSDFDDETGILLGTGIGGFDQGYKALSLYSRHLVDGKVFLLLAYLRHYPICLRFISR